MFPGEESPPLEIANSTWKFSKYLGVRFGMTAWRSAETVVWHKGPTTQNTGLSLYNVLTGGMTRWNLWSTRRKPSIVNTANIEKLGKFCCCKGNVHGSRSKCYQLGTCAYIIIFNREMPSSALDNLIDTAVQLHDWSKHFCVISFCRTSKFEYQFTKRLQLLVDEVPHSRAPAYRGFATGPRHWGLLSLRPPASASPGLFHFPSGSMDARISTVPVATSASKFHGFNVTIVHRRTVIGLTKYTR